MIPDNVIIAILYSFRNNIIIVIANGNNITIALIPKDCNNIPAISAIVIGRRGGMREEKMRGEEMNRI
jgi:hypothetical protein